MTGNFQLFFAGGLYRSTTSASWGGISPGNTYSSGGDAPILKAQCIHGQHPRSNMANHQPVSNEHEACSNEKYIRVYSERC
jgi:hypothetical protein